MCCCFDACHIILIVALVAALFPYMATIEHVEGKDPHWTVRTNDVLSSVMTGLKQVVQALQGIERVFSSK
jgi:hypothetical protein